MTRNETDPPEVDELARLIMAWIGMSMKLERSNGSIKVLADVGMTLQQMAALHILMFEGPMSVTALTDRIGLSLSATSSLLQRLVEQGLVRRVEDEKDRRQKVITLTPAGRKLIEKMMQSRLEELKGSVRHLSDAVRAQLAPVLRTIVEELGNLTHEHWGRGEHKDTDMRGQNLEGANFCGAAIKDARFDGANLEGAHMNGATLVDARFDGANVEGCVFANANLEGARFDGANIEGAVFDGANLKGAHFSKSNLEGASFAGADLDGARFDGCNLEGASFTRARNVPYGIGI